MKRSAERLRIEPTKFCTIFENSEKSSFECFEILGFESDEKSWLSGVPIRAGCQEVVRRGEKKSIFWGVKS